MRAFPIRTALTIVTFALLLAGASRVVRGVSTPNLETVAAIVEFTPDLTPIWPLQPHAVPEATAPVRARVVVPRYLLDGDGSLDRFYAALWRTVGSPGKTNSTGGTARLTRGAANTVCVGTH